MKTTQRLVFFSEIFIVSMNNNNKNEDRPILIPEHFEIGKFSGLPADFSKGKETIPRGGGDPLEYWYSEDPEESEYLQPEFQEAIELRIEQMKQEGWDPEKQSFYATGQSHFDLAWMWQFRQSVMKAEYTFEKAHRHFKMFEPWTFTGNQPLVITGLNITAWRFGIWFLKMSRTVGMNYKVGRGRIRWSDAGVKQWLGRNYMVNFLCTEFWKAINVEWFPDTFGYASNMPQIFAKQHRIFHDAETYLK